MCTTYVRTSVPAFRGMQPCYEIQMQPHEEGSLWVSEGTTRAFSPSEQTPIRILSFLDDSDILHLEYAEQGGQRTTRGIAEPDGKGGSHWQWAGTFRTDAAGASGYGHPHRRKLTVA